MILLDQIIQILGRADGDRPPRRMLGEFSNGPVRGGVAVQRDGMRPSRMRCRVKDWRGADALTSVRFQPLPIRTAREGPALVQVIRQSQVASWGFICARFRALAPFPALWRQHREYPMHTMPGLGR